MTRTVSRSPGTLPPVTLNPEEAAAIAVALAAQPEGPYAAAGRGALEKVLAALEPDPGRRSQLLATSLWVSAEAERTTEIRSAIEEAVSRRQVVALRYHDGQGNASRREVEPQLIVRSSDHVFLVAWCRERSALRWFRTDRIESAEPTGETAQRRDLTGLGAPPATGHPAGRKLRAAAEQRRPTLTLVPGGRRG
jgi:predicted DNA-binding transcriptional regulator YafY